MKEQLEVQPIIIDEVSRTKEELYIDIRVENVYEELRYNNLEQNNFGEIGDKVADGESIEVEGVARCVPHSFLVDLAWLFVFLCLAFVAFLLVYCYMYRHGML